VTAEQLGAHLAVVERRLADLAAGAQAYESDQARLSAESASSQRRLAAAESAAREQEGQWRSVGQGEHALFARVSELQLSGPPPGRLRALAFSIVDRVCMARLHGRAGCLTAPCAGFGLGHHQTPDGGDHSAPRRIEAPAARVGEAGERGAVLVFWPRGRASFNLAVYCCIPTGMHKPTCVCWASLTPLSPQSLEVQQLRQIEQVRAGTRAGGL
jgi:hypothetical protein